jgi:hypothetical protein
MTTVQVNGDDIMLAVHVVRIVGTIISVVVIGLLIAWAVRPSRRNRDRRETIENDAADNETMWRIVDRMEERLEVLERALADQVERPRVHAPRQDEIHAPADEGRDSGRTK